MNNKKKMVLGAAFVAAIVALAGVGYAVAISENFTGTTSSGTQTVDVDWVKISLTTTAQYSNRIVPINEAAFYWNSDTDASGTTWTPNPAAGLEMVYLIEYDLDAVEPTDLLQLEISGLTLDDDTAAAFDLEAKMGSTTLTIDTSTGKAIVGGEEGTAKSTFTTMIGDLTLTLVPKAITSGVPPTTAVFPALGLKITGQNVAPPSA